MKDAGPLSGRQLSQASLSGPHCASTPRLGFFCFIQAPAPRYSGETRPRPRKKPNSSEGRTSDSTDPGIPREWDHQAPGGINPAAEALARMRAASAEGTESHSSPAASAGRPRSLLSARPGRGFRRRPPYPARRLVGAGTGGRKQPRPQPD